MAFWVWTEIVCLGCSDTMAGRHSSRPRIARREMAKEATQYNWHLMDGEWFCPTCTPKRYEIAKAMKTDG